MPPRRDHHTSRRVSRYTLVVTGPPVVYRLPRASPEIFTSVSAESRTPRTADRTEINGRPKGRHPRDHVRPEGWLLRDHGRPESPASFPSWPAYRPPPPGSRPA